MFWSRRINVDLQNGGQKRHMFKMINDSNHSLHCIGAAEYRRCMLMRHFLLSIFSIAYSATHRPGIYTTVLCCFVFYRNFLENKLFWLLQRTYRPETIAITQYLFTVTVRFMSMYFSLRLIYVFAFEHGMLHEPMDVDRCSLAYVVLFFSPTFSWNAVGLKFEMNLFTDNCHFSSFFFLLIWIHNW